LFNCGYQIFNKSDQNTIHLLIKCYCFVKKISNQKKLYFFKSHFQLLCVIDDRPFRNFHHFKYFFIQREHNEIYIISLYTKILILKAINWMINFWKYWLIFLINSANQPINVPHNKLIWRKDNSVMYKNNG